MKVYEKIINIAVLNIMSLYGNFCRKRYLHRSESVDKIFEKQLLKLLKKNRNTEYGRKYNFASIHSIKEFQDKVPLSEYDDIRSYLERTAEKGEQNLLSSEKIEYLASTSGTTGVTKMLPVSEKTYIPYVRCASIFIWMLKQEMNKRGIRGGKGLESIETDYKVTKGGIKLGFISGYALDSARIIMPAINVMPKESFGYGDDIDIKYIKARYALQDRDLVYMMSVFMSYLTDLVIYMIDHQDMLINDIEKGIIDESVNIPLDMRKKLSRKLRPDPKRAEEIRQVLKQEDRQGMLSKLWPKLTMIVAIGTGEFRPYKEKMKFYCNNDVLFCNEMYAASEALFASAMEPETYDYLLIPDAGFFEFLPVDNEDSRPLLAHELEKGKQYEIIVTTFAGLYRYQIKDVVSVTDFVGKNPMIQFAYRKNQLINIKGVKLTIEHLDSTIAAFEKRSGIKVRDYSIYSDVDQVPWRAVIYLELEEDPADLDVRAIMEEELMKANEEYARMLGVGDVSPLMVKIVKDRTFEFYRRMRVHSGVSTNQVKTIRFIYSKEKKNYFDEQTIKTYEKDGK